MINRKYRNVVVDNELKIGAGGNFRVDRGSVTLASNTGTLNKMAGVITTESLNTAGAASQALTITDSKVSASDIIVVSQIGGTNTTRAISFVAVASAGSFVITVYNNTAATALNGTLILGFVILKA